MQRTLFWIWVANIAVAKSLEMEENIFSDHTYANLSRLQFSPFFEGPWLSIECIKLKEAFFVQCWQKDSFQSSNYMEERRFPETQSQINLKLLIFGVFDKIILVWHFEIEPVWTALISDPVLLKSLLSSKLECYQDQQNGPANTRIGCCYTTMKSF